MEMSKVESSNIAEVGYDANSGKLRVRFLSSGGLYEYDDVPKNVAEDFLLAESKGKFFHANIKNQHKARKVDETVTDDANNALQGTAQVAANDADATDTPGSKKRASKKTRHKPADDNNGDD